MRLNCVLRAVGKETAARGRPLQVQGLVAAFRMESDLFLQRGSIRWHMGLFPQTQVLISPPVGGQEVFLFSEYLHSKFLSL